MIAGGSVMPAEATTGADGEAEFRYTPEDAPQNRVEFRTENGRAVTFYGLGAPFATVESIRNAASFAPGRSANAPADVPAAAMSSASATT